MTRDTRPGHRSPRISRSISRRRVLELVRPSTRPVEWAHIVSLSSVMNADGHRAANSRSLLALLQSLTGVLSGFAIIRASSFGRSAWFGNRKFFEHANEVRFHFCCPNTGYKFSGTNEDAIFGPRIAAETCGKKDGVNSSA